MTDALLFHTDDGGEIEYTNGTLTMESGLRGAAYLSLFGGNEDDDGTSATAAVQWWGNLTEPVEARRQRSETQAALRGLPLIPASMRKVEGAALRDLAWMLESLADDVRASASMPSRNRMDLRIEIDVGDETYVMDFTEAR